MFGVIYNVLEGNNSGMPNMNTTVVSNYGFLAINLCTLKVNVSLHPKRNYLRVLMCIWLAVVSNTNFALLKFNVFRLWIWGMKSSTDLSVYGYLPIHLYNYNV